MEGVTFADGVTCSQLPPCVTDAVKAKLLPSVEKTAVRACRSDGEEREISVAPGCRAEAPGTIARMLTVAAAQVTPEMQLRVTVPT